MNRHAPFVLAAFVFVLLLPSRGFASHNPADYPLRVHIFNHNGVSHYWGPYGSRSLEDVDGEGRANLYENSEPRAFDFHYECEERLMNSVGYETLPARWKKPNLELEVLNPISGKTCKFHVAMRDGIAYHFHDGKFGEEPAEKFKAWMDKYQYDPEHGKNEPVRPVEATASSLDPASFPLRVHIFSHTGVSHYNSASQTDPEVVEGEGRANLYENSEPRAFDFSYRCAARLLDSIGYETYLARWNTPGRELEIMQPATDKTCVLLAALKENIAYKGDNDHIEEESSAAYKQWMDANQYDPEHGKNFPAKPLPATGSSTAN
jgi:hypothetical protein